MIPPPPAPPAPPASPRASGVPAAPALPPSRTPAPTPAAHRRWRHSLYARATLFLLLGGGILVGALIAMSSRLIDDSVERLLEDRIDYARTVGALVEQRLVNELHHLTHRVVDGLELGLDTPAARAAVTAEYRSSIFSEGVVVLDDQGYPRLALPGGGPELSETFHLPALAARSRALGGPVVSTLGHLASGNRPALMIVQPAADRRGRFVGFVGGLLQPGSTNLLEGITGGRGRAVADLELVDAQGTVVAATKPANLYRAGDHEDVLAKAVAGGREFKGRCHSCHQEGNDLRRHTDVLSFSPLPTLALGMAVYQGEAEALAPAFALRRQLVLITGTVAIFIVFLGFAVHAVVRPVVRLTRAVAALGTTGGPTRLPRFGRDEVGELSSTVERWRDRLLESRDEADAQRGRLHAEAEAIRRHLASLDEIVTLSTMGADVAAILTGSLRRALGSLGLAQGGARLSWEGQAWAVHEGLGREVAAALLGRAGELDLGPAEERLTPAGPGRCSLKTLTHHELVHGLEPVGTVVLSSLLAPHGLSVQMVMTSPTPGLQIEERWVHSLLYHVSMATTSRILRDRDAERQQQQERYLRGLLRAQEDERARIARDLHDTIAQDLAALRLEIERLSNRADAGALGPDLAGLEARTATILQTTRGILLDLRLTVLEGMGFLPSLQWHLERLEREHGIHGTLAVEGEPRRLPYHLSVPLFRIFQECVNNVVQHAEAEQVVATVVWGDDLLRLTVRDDGRGFDAGADTADGHASGLGLLGIGERTRLLGGSLAIASRRDEGTTVTVEVPLPAPPIEEDP